METKEIFEETGKLGNEIKKIHKKLDNINLNIINLMKICNHDIVFKFRDNHPRKMLIEGRYFCPACGKSEKTSYYTNIKDTSFCNSRVIPLDNISLLGTPDDLQKIRIEVYNNFDFYYNKEIDTSALSKKMESEMKDNEYDYNKEKKLIKDIKRR